MGTPAEREFCAAADSEGVSVVESQGQAFLAHGEGGRRMFNANKLTRVRFGPEHGDPLRFSARPNPRNRNRSAFEDRQGSQFCAAAGFDGGPENQKVGAAVEA